MSNANSLINSSLLNLFEMIEKPVCELREGRCSKEKKIIDLMLLQVIATLYLAVITVKCQIDVDQFFGGVDDWFPNFFLLFCIVFVPAIKYLDSKWIGCF